MGSLLAGRPRPGRGPGGLRVDQRLGLAEERSHGRMVAQSVGLDLLAELIEPRTGLVAVTEAVMRHGENGDD